MKLNITTAKLNRLIKKHLLESIDIEDKKGNLIENPTIQARIDYASSRFNNEMSGTITRSGNQQAIESWLRGLAINVDFYNNDIIKMYEGWGAINKDLTDDEHTALIDSYWHSLAFNLSALFRGHFVPRTLEG